MGLRIVEWRGEKVLALCRERVALALGDLGLVVEGASKGELFKGHGVLTGTLRRSIHTAQPGYNWEGDNMPNGPDRGGQSVRALIQGNSIKLQVGSGMEYAMAVNQGWMNEWSGASFEGYHYMNIGLRFAVKKWPAILRKYKV